MSANFDSSNSPQESERRIPDLIVVPSVAVITVLASLGIFAASKKFEAGLAWVISLFVFWLVVGTIPRTHPYGSSIRLGIALGIGGALGLVLLFWM